MNQSRKTYTAAAALLILIATALMASCQKKDVVSLYEKQATNISNYVAKVLKDSLDSYASYNDGVTRITLEEGSGPLLAKGDQLTFSYAAYTFGTSIQTSNLFDTNDPWWAQKEGWIGDAESLEPSTLDFTKDNFLKGLLLGLEGVQAGERCIVLFTGEHGFGARPVGVVGSYSALAYRVRVEEIKKR